MEELVALVAISHAGVNVSPRRVILHVVMLLRDSEIVKVVRNQLLNIEEKTKSEARVADIDEEIKLQMEVGQAFMSRDINALAQANEKLIEFKSCHITKIEKKLQEQKTVKNVSKEEVQYKNPGQILRKLFNQYAVVIHVTIWTNKGSKTVASPCK
ncbi:TPA: hypothetical protein ACTZ5A_005457 [Bacillus cereus]